MARPIYVIQPAFTGGEISDDVASRIDLEKYQLALLNAENAVVRPYGAVKKRTGSAYCGATKENGKAVLKRFEFASELSYLLEFGAGYLRIWRQGEYLGVELPTPYAESDLTRIRTVQSVDVMYVCTGVYPVYKLCRYSESSWTFNAVNWALAPFKDESPNESVKVKTSGATGSVTITASGGVFSANNVGDYIKIEQRIPGRAVSASISGTEDTDTIRVGEQWKIITHGTWTGTLYLQLSHDEGETWTDIRTYTGAKDFNPTESGTVEEMALVKVHAVITGGSVKIDLSTYAYRNIGYAKITACSSSTAVTATTIKRFEADQWSSDFRLSAWGKGSGYPYTATFFQDRLVLGGCPGLPQRLWMSRTGDYENFEVEKAGGSVTDDSAISVDLLSQQPFTIQHLMAANDLIVHTEGDTWTISGSEVVTPSNISPRNQESHGANHVRVMHVGSKSVYVQRRGSAVRDIGYAYDTDSYVGVDLSLLAKHLLRGKKIVDGDYAQEPDSILYFVRNDGVMLCLTYIPEQKVYGWSHFVTEGRYEAVCIISEGEEDRVYAIVNRTIDGETCRYLERFALDKYTDHQQDYRMMDAYIYWESEEGSNIIDGLDHLEGKAVEVIADNYYYDNEKHIVTDGQITLPEEVKEAVVGLPYTFRVEQPNFDIGNTDTGTIQGRNKNVVAATLRVTRSYGGSIGPDESTHNKIIFDKERLELGEDVLYTGDKKVVLGIGGYNLGGRVCIKQDEPFPFNLTAIIREVSLSDL